MEFKNSLPSVDKIEDKSNFLKENITEILAVMGLTGAYIFIYMLIFVKVPPENKDLVNILGGGIVVAIVCGICGYYWGAAKTRPTVTQSQDLVGNVSTQKSSS